MLKKRLAFNLYKINMSLAVFVLYEKTPTINFPPVYLMRFKSHKIAISEDQYFFVRILHLFYSRKMISQN